MYDVLTAWVVSHLEHCQAIMNCVFGRQKFQKKLRLYKVQIDVIGMYYGEQWERLIYDNRLSAVNGDLYPKFYTCPTLIAQVNTKHNPASLRN